MPCDTLPSRAQMRAQAEPFFVIDDVTGLTFAAFSLHMSWRVCA